ncbi:hypothetical protein GCM10011349_46360 [Novosphingobium indicum]|uniref:Uncharacterized protein n=1 Tax=Novosphingobium indicum TaxID=462949 RepID=A0ABQ2K0Q7_9SPHN|nr:hypothetical protein [Novosphingobium indicum]GGN62559.1 hypothetical protein GCM10011349_46360 [Novosphingobium indicum]
MPTIPTTTDHPGQTGAGAKTDEKAKAKVAPTDRTGTVAWQGQASPAPVTTDIDEPGAPDPTTDRPDRGPRGGATAGACPGKKAKQA